MSEREELLLRTLLQGLSQLDLPAADTLLHAALQTHLGVRVTLAEFEAARDCCENKRWINGVPGLFGRTRWAITAAGRLALAEMNA